MSSIHIAGMANRIEVSDAFEFLDSLPDESVDLVLTDPPYETLRRWEGTGTTARMGMGRPGTKSHDPDKFFETISNDMIPLLLSHFYRVLKPQRYAYVMKEHCKAENIALLPWIGNSKLIRRT